MNKELYNKLSVAAEYSDIVTNAAFKLEEKKNEPERIKQKFYEDHKFKFVGLHIFLSVVSWMGTIWWSLWIFAAILVIFPDGYTAESISLFIILPIFLFAISFFCAIVLNRHTAYKEKKRQKLFDKTVPPLIEKSNAEFNEMWNAFQEFVDKNIHVLNFLPEQYRDPQAISYMLVSVSSGRAETFKEAMNLYELQLHRWKVEDAARQAAEAQEYAALAMQELNRQQAQANATLKSIEYMQWYDYMDRKYRE